MNIGTPQPTVLHLLTVFRQISAGQIRIPAFQRAFVWKEKQVIDLLESVRLGFPIGSILLWHVERPILRIASQAQTSFPSLEEKYPTSYVLDGMQRLSSLYGVFHFGTSTSDPRFNVWFDLQEEKFVHEDFIEFEQRNVSIPMAALFATRTLLSYQSQISKLSNADILIDRLVGLQAAFQDYMIPVVVIGGEEVAPIVRVFESINSKGTTLSRVDFMRAITWAQDFDLSDSLDSASLWLDKLGFALPEETIVKCVAMLMAIDPTAESLLTLRSKSSEELEGAFQLFRRTFSKVHSFLHNELSVRSNDFVPYEGQILVLFKALGVDNATNPRELDGLKRWFWATSFNESLRGKPDHYVVRAVNNWSGLIHGAIRGLEPRLKLDAFDFMERRLIRGKALSSAFTAMFAASGARDIRSGALIESNKFMSESDPKVFLSLLDAQELDLVSVGGGAPTRVFANLILDPDGWLHNWSMFSARSAISAAATAGDDSILRTQFIDLETARLLLDGDHGAFLTARANLLKGAAHELVETGKLAIA
jgi:hypothetical protein